MEGRAQPELERRGQVLASRSGRLHDQRGRQSARRDGRPLFRRRHGDLRPGREPGERQGLRHQHRRAERGAVRGEWRRVHAAPDGARPPARGADQRARRRRRQPPPPEQAHRLQRGPEPGRGEGQQPGDPGGHGGHRRRGDALHRGQHHVVRAVVHHRRARERYLRAQLRDPHSRDRRRAERPRAERESPLCLDAFRQRDLGHRHQLGARDGDRPPATVQPRAGERGERAPLPL